MGRLLQPLGTAASNDSYKIINIIINGSTHLTLTENKLLFKNVHKTTKKLHKEISLTLFSI